MGIQIHANDNYRRVVELIQADAIGPVREVTSGCRAPGAGSRGEGGEDENTRHRLRSAERAAEGPVAGARRRSTGTSGWARPRPGRSTRLCPGAEMVSLVGFRQRHDVRPRQPLERPAVLGAEAACPADHRGHRPAAAPGNRPGLDARDLRIRRPRRHAGGEADVVSGREQARALDEDGAIPQWGNGVLFVGDKGMLLADYGKHVLLPEKNFARLQAARADPAAVTRPPRRVDRGLQDAARRDLADFEYSGWLTEANHLGNVAYRAGKKLDWDAAKHEGHQRPGGRAVHPPRLPQGLGTVTRSNKAMGRR